MLTDGPAPGLAHGIGAAAVPKVELGGVEGPRALGQEAPRPPPDPVSPRAAAMEDDVPEVTEWTAERPAAAPQPRQGPATASGSPEARAAAAEAEAARKEGRPVIDWTRSSHPDARAGEGREPEPGLWVEAFMAGLKGGDDDQKQTPGETNSPAPTEADDEGDLK